VNHSGGQRPRRLVVSAAIGQRMEAIAGIVPEVRRLVPPAGLALPVLAVWNVPLEVDATFEPWRVLADGEAPGDSSRLVAEVEPHDGLEHDVFQCRVCSRLFGKDAATGVRTRAVPIERVGEVKTVSWVCTECRGRR
jgi:hypothetical protein